jgi:hypothetical protein
LRGRRGSIYGVGYYFLRFLCSLWSPSENANIYKKNSLLYEYYFASSGLGTDADLCIGPVKSDDVLLKLESPEKVAADLILYD